MEVNGMLKSFQIENFNSIKNPIIFSMEAETELTEKQEYINVLDENSKLLRVASIYGPNASGKSTLLLALHFVNDIVSGRLSLDFHRESSTVLHYAPFEFRKIKDNHITASILFARKGLEYWYRFTAEFVFDHEPFFVIENEYFGVKKTHDKAFDTVFSREKNVITANAILELIGATKLPVSNNTTLLRFLKMNYISDDEDISIDPDNNHLKYVADLYEEIQSMRLIKNL